MGQDEYIDRPTAMRLLGVSHVALTQLHRRKMLVPRIRERFKKHFYLRSEVEQFKATHSYWKKGPASKPLFFRPEWWYDKDAIEKCREMQRELQGSLNVMVQRLGTEVFGAKQRYKQTKKTLSKLHAMLTNLRIQQKELDRWTRQCFEAIETGNVVLTHKGTLDELRKKLVPDQYIDTLVQERMNAMPRQEEAHVG